MKKLLIGGQALVKLGSSRSTNDTDYLVNDLSTKSAFIHLEGNVDLINANGSKFFAEIWAMEINSIEFASINALIELKAYALVQHCLNGAFLKADEAEFDIKYLTRIGAKLPTIVKKYVSAGQYAEIVKVIKDVKF